jgi:chlorite dismutase
MAEQTPRTLNHFALLSFTQVYWELPPEQRTELRRELFERLAAAAPVVHRYQAYGMEAGCDLILWSALEAGNPQAARQFFSGVAAALAPVRRMVILRNTLWGFTRPSSYTKVRSTQEIDPFAAERLPYLIIYPFVKTAEWYLKPFEERQKMMFGHIKIGKQYDDITQLLLYSFGLQDHEFVVVYETHDLTRFLDLVNELRSTEARIFTARDWPLHTALYQPDDEALARWL